MQQQVGRVDVWTGVWTGQFEQQPHLLLSICLELGPGPRCARRSAYCVRIGRGDRI